MTNIRAALLGLSLLFIAGFAAAQTTPFAESWEGTFCASSAWTCAGSVTTTTYLPPDGSRSLALYAGSSVERQVDTTGWESGQLSGSWLSYGQTLPGEALRVEACESPSDCVTVELTDTVPGTLVWETWSVDVSAVVGGMLTLRIELDDSANMGAAPDRGFADDLELVGTGSPPPPPPPPPPTDPAIDLFAAAGLDPLWAQLQGSNATVSGGQLRFGSSWAFLMWQQTFDDDQFSEVTIPVGMPATAMIQAWVRGVDNGTRRYAFGCHTFPEHQPLSQWYIKFDGPPSPQTRTLYGAPCAQVAGDVLRVEARNSPDNAWVWVRGLVNGVPVIDYVDTAADRSLTGRPGLTARTQVGETQVPGTPIAESWRGGSL